jgi:hypothetical protein
MSKRGRKIKVGSVDHWTWAKAEEVARKRAAELAGIAAGEVPAAKSDVTVRQAAEQWIASASRTS